MLCNEGDPLRRVIVSSPRREYVTYDDPRLHNITERANPAEALRQHDHLKEVMRASGADVIDIPELGGHPNSVFTRDPIVVTPRGYVRLHMGLATRRGEEAWLAEALERMGEPPAGAIQPPGTVEGGDVILAGTVAFLGLSGRTNSEGHRQMRALLEGMGYQVRSARVPPQYLHIGGAMSLVAPDRVLACVEAFPPDFFRGFDVISVPPGDFIGGNVICLGPNEVIAEAGQRVAIERLERAGVKVHVLDLWEFVKGTGGPSCLILPVER